MRSILHYSLKLTNRYWIAIGMLVCMALACSSDEMMPNPDCGTLVDVKINGRVVNEVNEPLSGTSVIIRSQEKTCQNAGEFETIHLATDLEGHFTGNIDYISEGQVLEIAFSYQEHEVVINYATYVTFDEFLEVTIDTRSVN